MSAKTERIRREQMARKFSALLRRIGPGTHNPKHRSPSYLRRMERRYMRRLERAV